MGVRTYKGKYNIIGERVKYYRNQNKMSAEKLSTKLTLLGFESTANTIFKIEMGSRTVTDFELGAIAKSLNVSLDDLMSDYMKKL